MRLYLKPGACSLASHIVLHEAGETFDTVKVDTTAGTTADGRSFRGINPKGYAPVLELDDGQILTEGAAILQFIADRHPGARLAPPAGTLERARVQEHLNYVASEVHKAYGGSCQSNLACRRAEG
jgi:glutathione S-transferase